MCTGNQRTLNITDSLIQQTIRDKFQECTVVTTAHGLNTIIDCDRILVLDARIQGYDEPYVLLHDHRGLSYQMVQQTSQAEAASPLCTAKQVTTPTRISGMGLSLNRVQPWHTNPRLSL
ncbi:hypothetical protein Q8A73_009979 [Channa argus]|nr:hypothetical protein Q8A73_009979 [Channa argus]